MNEFQYLLHVTDTQRFVKTTHVRPHLHTLSNISHEFQSATQRYQKNPRHCKRCNTQHEQMSIEPSGHDPHASPTVHLPLPFPCVATVTAHRVQPVVKTTGEWDRARFRSSAGAVEVNVRLPIFRSLKTAALERRLGVIDDLLQANVVLVLCYTTRQL